MGGWRSWIQGAESVKAQIVEIIRFVPLEGLKCGVGFDKIRGTRKGMGLMKSKFIGRDAEMSQLAELWGKRASSLVVCRGFGEVENLVEGGSWGGDRKGGNDGFR